MFTGIIGARGRVIAVDGGAERRFRIAADLPGQPLVIGGAMACDGVRLTVLALGPATDPWFEVQASAETLACTTLGGWVPGRAVNLERALRLGDEMGGHIVTGHVDGLAEVLEASPEGQSLRLWLRAPAGLARLIAPKGAVALDGTSLTVNAVDGAEFGVNLIAHTMAVTNWSDCPPGRRVNIEADVMARYLARLQGAD